MQTGTSRVTPDTNQRPAQSAAPRPKLLDQVRQAIRARHYSKRTEKTYIWLRMIERSEILKPELQAGIIEENKELCRLFTSSLKTARANKR